MWEVKNQNVTHLSVCALPLCPGLSNMLNLMGHLSHQVGEWKMGECQCVCVCVWCWRNRRSSKRGCNVSLMCCDVAVTPPLFSTSIILLRWLAIKLLWWPSCNVATACCLQSLLKCEKKHFNSWWQLSAEYQDLYICSDEVLGMFGPICKDLCNAWWFFPVWFYYTKSINCTYNYIFQAVNRLAGFNYYIYHICIVLFSRIISYYCCTRKNETQFTMQDLCSGQASLACATCVQSPDNIHIPDLEWYLANYSHETKWCWSPLK